MKRLYCRRVFECVSRTESETQSEKIEPGSAPKEMADQRVKSRANGMSTEKLSVKEDTAK